MFRIAKQLAKERLNIVKVNCLRDESGSIVVKSELRWKEYMEHLLNVDDIWDAMVKGWIVGGPRESITEMEVENAPGQMEKWEGRYSG